MAYEFRPDEPVGTAAVRIGTEQVAAALAWLDVAAGDAPDRDDSGGDGPTTEHDRDLEGEVVAFVDGEVDRDTSVEEAVHEARKCCKRIRGLARLVRPAMEEAYDATNAATRDAARQLSPIRDAHALLATFDELVAALADQVPDGGILDVRAGLAQRAEAATETVSTNLDRIGAARRLLTEARGLVAEWPVDDLDQDDLADAVAGGIAKTAGRARNRFVDVVATDGPPPDELLHQWRKRVKYSWYHVSLLEPAAPTLLGTLADLHHDLSDVLGDDHDLAVLSATLRADPDSFGGDDQVDAALLLVDGTRRDLQRRAVAVGARLHAEEPDALGTRLVALLEAWWQHGPERRAGEIEELHGVADDLGDRTNGQLRELARERDLPGRSRLDRVGLLAALRAAGAGR